MSESTERKTLAEVLADGAEGARVESRGGVGWLVVPGALEVMLGADLDWSDVRLSVREALAWAAQQARDHHPVKLALEIARLRVEVERMRPIVEAAERYVNALDEPDPGIAEAVGAAWRVQRERRPKAPGVYACTSFTCVAFRKYVDSGRCAMCDKETTRLANGGAPDANIFKAGPVATIPVDPPLRMREGDALVVDLGPDRKPIGVRVLDGGKPPGQGGAS